MIYCQIPLLDLDNLKMTILQLIIALSPLIDYFGHKQLRILEFGIKFKVF